MKLRHTAALALVGWYLMMPPYPKVDEPLNKWSISKAFKTAQDCNAEKQRRAEENSKILKAN